MLDSLDAWANGETVSPAIAPTYTPRARVSRRRAASPATVLLSTLATKPAAALPGVVTSAHPFADSEIAWLTEAGNNRFGFALSIMRQMRDGRALTANQIATVQRLTVEAAERKAVREAHKNYIPPAPLAPVAAPVIDAAPVAQIAPVARFMGSVDTPAAPEYVAPSVAVPADTLDAVTLSPTPIATNWPVLFSTPEGNSVSDTGGNVLCIAAAGLPVKFSRFGAPGNAPVTVTINESVWRDFVALSRADFIANHLS